MSNLVVYEMGGVIVVNELNIDESVSIVVILMATLPMQLKGKKPQHKY